MKSRSFPEERPRIPRMICESLFAFGQPLQGFPIENHDLAAGCHGDDLVVANFLDMRSIAQSLLAGIEAIARGGGYQEVRVNLADSNMPHRQAVADALNSVGHVRTIARFAKPLAQPLKPIVGH